MTNAQIVALLRETADLVSASEASLWSSRRPSEVAKTLEGEIAEITAGRHPNSLELRVLFAPTGAIQEIALANGWSERYMQLASGFDTAVVTGE